MTIRQSELCDLFAEAVAETTYGNLTPQAVEAAKKSVLDTLGVILAASGLEPCVRPVVALALESGGAPQSSLLGFRGRVPAQVAAMVNAAMAHCLDFDDRTTWGGHCGSSLIPATLALAERTGAISGEKLIAAVAAGQDLFIRLRRSVSSDKNWNISTVMGVFSATASAAHLLGLNRTQIVNALGIASLQSSGTMQVVLAGSHLRGMYAGFSAHSAVVAALLAQKGLTGIDGVFEGQAGVFNAYFDGQYDRASIVTGLGRDYLGATMLYKPWPVVGLAHTYIHAVIQLMTTHNLAPADIAQIRVFVADRQLQMCTPIERRREPQTAVDAKFSLPFCVALAAVHREIKISDFTSASLQDAQVLAMARKVVPVENQANSLTAKTPVGRVQILTNGGLELDQEGVDVPGSPQAPLTWEDLARKFVDCAGAAAIPVEGAKAASAVALMARLEELDDVADVVRNVVFS